MTDRIMASVSEKVRVVWAETQLVPCCSGSSYSLHLELRGNWYRVPSFIANFPSTPATGPQPSEGKPQTSTTVEMHYSVV